MSNRPCGNEFRTTMVCVDSYQEGVPAGRLYNPYLTGRSQFQSLMQFLLMMEDLLNEMRFPQSFTEIRTFAPPAEKDLHPKQTEEPQEGKCATFAVRVLFRQNASWQGSVTWLEEGREESFRSTLELILLMESALSARASTI